MHLKLPADLFNKLQNMKEDKPMQAKIISILKGHFDNSTPQKIKGEIDEKEEHKDKRKAQYPL